MAVCSQVLKPTVVEVPCGEGWFGHQAMLLSAFGCVEGASCPASRTIPLSSLQSKAAVLVCAGCSAGGGRIPAPNQPALGVPLQCVLFVNCALASGFLGAKLHLFLLFCPALKCFEAGNDEFLGEL